MIGNELCCETFKGSKDQQLVKDKSDIFHSDDSPYRVAKLILILQSIGIYSTQLRRVGSYVQYLSAAV